MELYRGCKESGIKIMYPKVVNHNNPYVYATVDKIEAIIYSIPGGNFNYTNIYGYDDDGKRCLIERKKNTLKSIFSKEGRYYILDSKTFFKHNVMGVGEGEYVSKSLVKVIKEVSIPNVYDYLKELEKCGRIKIYEYPSRPRGYPSDDSDLIECAMVEYLNSDSTFAFDLLEKYHPYLIDRIKDEKDYIKSHTKEEIRRRITFF